MAVTKRRKLLTAAVGVATVSYVVACGGLGGGETSGNLVPPIGGSSGSGYGGAETSGNLVAAGGADFIGSSGGPGHGGGETSGNLMAPPPVQDAGTGGSAPAIDGGHALPDSGPPTEPADAAAAVGDAAVD
jgi:hypothetical protein